MVNQQLIRKLADSEDKVVPSLFKPVQFNIIKKLNAGQKLAENEKRYLRGKMKEKLIALASLESKEEYDGIGSLLESIGSYYITGLEALRHNGYGWYFRTKTIEVINTRIEGKINILGNTFKFVRIKSMENSKYSFDKKNGLKYAENEQIFYDARLTKNEYVRSVWIQMLSRYGKMFAKPLKQFVLEERKVDYAKYGV